MALIKCTECGHDVSERAKQCPNCGCPVHLMHEEIIKCPECGKKVPTGKDTCPNCGCPMEEETELVPVTVEEINKKAVETEEKEAPTPPKDDKTETYKLLIALGVICTLIMWIMIASSNK